ncbi:conserved hypothetical protein [delta proteobacterium NaphS2]|nr:conserved hypothetical protein [delta proteobacterium NaphS2]
MLPSIQGLATRWLVSLPGRGSHPLKYATMPGRTFDGNLQKDSKASL